MSDMISLTKALSAERVQAQADVLSQKRALETLSILLSDQDTVQQDAIFSALLAREKIGSTALGHGVAIPHAHIHTLAESRVAMLTLAEPIGFEGVESPVDLFIGLIVPTNAPDTHTDLLSQITTLMRRAGFRASLRDAKNNTSLYNALLMAAVVYDD